MKPTVLFIFALLMSLAGYAQEYKVKFPSGGKGTLRVNIDRTKLSIEGYNGDEVIITVEGRTPVPEKAKGLKPLYKGGIDNTGLGIEVSVEGSFVDVEKAMASEMRMKIRVPKQAAIQVQETEWQGEHIHIQDVEGAIEVTARSSDINIKNARSVIAKTTAGSIEVTFSSLHPEFPSALITTSGEVDVTMPADSKALLRTKCISGDIFTDFDVVMQSNKENQQHLNRNQIEGAINGGGTELRLASLSGNIYLRKKK